MPTLEIIGNESDTFILDSKASPSATTGGKTGSTPVRSSRGITYQYKPSIAYNNLKRRAKSLFSDSENFGEVLAARIAKQFDTDPEHPRVPSVFFVTDARSPYVGIVSQYLEGEKVRILDDYLGKPPEKAHIKLISGEEDIPNGIHNIDKDPILKREIAHAIAMSSICIDHDLNPGNMIVIQNGDDFRIGRIDYGHAFKNLMRFSSFGGKQLHQNNIIDFFNRETIDGIPSAESKLWRDYPGLIPSLDMAEALKSLANQDNVNVKIKSALDEVKEEIKTVLKKPLIDKAHIIYSLQRIAEHVSDKKIDPSLMDENKIDVIFEQLREYVVKNMQQMAYAGKIMDLQVCIQEAVKKQDNRAIVELRKIFVSLEFEGVGKKDLGPFSWIKESDKLPAFKGDFNQYVTHQSNLIKLNSSLAEINAFLIDENTISHEKLIVSDLKNIIINPKITVEEKILLLAKKIESIDQDPRPKSSFLVTITNNIRKLFVTRGTTDALVSNPLNPTDNVRKFKDLKDNIKRILANDTNESLEEGGTSPNHKA